MLYIYNLVPFLSLGLKFLFFMFYSGEGMFDVSIFYFPFLGVFLYAVLLSRGCLGGFGFRDIDEEGGLDIILH